MKKQLMMISLLTTVSLLVEASAAQRKAAFREQVKAGNNASSSSNANDNVPPISEVSDAQMNAAVAYDPAGSAAACQQVLTKLGLSSDTPNITVLHYIGG